ncbi:hypothetical protein C3L33_17611, partial [Rhododendron williamsianum]
MNDHHQQPPSPGVRPIKAKDCIEELLKFTLSSSIDGTLGLDVGLSKDYCSKLLNDDDGPEINPTPNASDSSLKHKEVAWIALVMEKGSELINVLENVDFELHVQEPFFSQLKDGMKTVEGRCAVGDYNRYLSSLHYSSVKVKAFLEKAGVQIYRKFYSEEKEKLNGVLAIGVTKPAAQPFISLAGMLSVSMLAACPYVKGSTLTDGARALAKHVDRSGSNIGVLSMEVTPLLPCAIVVLSIIVLPFKAVHFGMVMYAWEDRDWSSLYSTKNRLAKDAISHLMAHCCWQNMHVVPPHGVVYEIRTADGYGARWSEDGNEFIGFLEPYMEDGHSNRWKH